MNRASVLITDVDNTLFDWFGSWYASFSAMLNSVVQISGVSAEELYPEIRSIHQKAGTSEYSQLLGQMPTLQRLYGKPNVLTVMEPAISAFREARRRTLRLYPTVPETLATAKKQGALIVAYTESQAFYTSYRFKKLGLDELVDVLFSPPDHELPDGTTKLSIRSKPPSEYEFSHTKHLFTPKGELKPNPKLLKDILSEVGVTANDAVYVGDSLVKDISMAKDADVTDFYAEYGSSHSQDKYKLLVNVTHWNDEDVARERETSTRHVSPTNILKNSFGEILKKVEFYGR